jgi:hypothetical protein
MGSDYDPQDFRGHHSVPLHGQKLLGLDPSGAEMACWYASAKMIADTGGVDNSLDALKALFTPGSHYDNVQIKIILTKLNFLVPGSLPGEPWTADRLEGMLFDYGPLLAYGAFGDEKAKDFSGLPTHAIVITGMLDGLWVRYNDPWQPKRDWMTIKRFGSLISNNHDSIMSHRKHWNKEMKKVPTGKP